MVLIFFFVAFFDVIRDGRLQQKIVLNERMDSLPSNVYT